MMKGTWLGRSPLDAQPPDAEGRCRKHGEEPEMIRFFFGLPLLRNRHAAISALFLHLMQSGSSADSPASKMTPMLTSKSSGPDLQQSSIHGGLGATARYSPSKMSSFWFLSLRSNVVVQSTGRYRRLWSGHTMSQETGAP